MWRAEATRFVLFRYKMPKESSLWSRRWFDAPEPIQRFSTQNVAPAARFRLLGGCRQSCASAVERPSRRRIEFRGVRESGKSWRFGHYPHAGSAHHSWRTRQDVERGEEPNSYHLLVSRGGPWAMAQRGQKYLPGAIWCFMIQSTPIVSISRVSTTLST